MDYKTVISEMKSAEFPVAQAHAVEIPNATGVRIGRLIPVGPWILDDHERIAAICSWRSRAMKTFLTQFDSTVEKTATYLKELSIGEPGRLLFALHDHADRFVGHLGISNVDGRNGELDNVVRGVAGGDPRLVYFAEVALLDWCFRALGILQSDARVLSYNWMAIALHEEIGYRIAEEWPLRKTEKDGLTIHEPVDRGRSNVTYTCARMVLSREDFYARNAARQKP